MAEGFHDFAAAEVLTAANTDDYLMRQTVMRFASVAARDSALAAVLAEGMVTTEHDINRITAYDGTSWWTVGATSASATGFTPTLVQGGTVTKTVTVSEWRVIDGVCEWWFNLLVSAAGTAGSAVTLGLPVTASGDSRAIGSGVIYDVSVPTNDSGEWELVSTTAISLVCSRSTTGYWGVTPNLAINTSDTIRGHVRYLVAAAA